ncbi:hypothetical protein ACFY00_33770 [Kitasatospora sp. NPDC001540]|uniref:hypothetical protein n=1 Tax=Kitasatospora sp. NPDC001540 TaxID=3364014 RepID=UPI0036C783A0
MDCGGGHRLPAPWPQWQRRVRSGGRCADKDDGLVTEERPRLFGRRALCGLYLAVTVLLGTALSFAGAGVADALG